MTGKHQELLQLFGQLMQQRAFMGAAFESCLSDEQRHHRNGRGPLRVLQLLDEQGEQTNANIAEVFDIRPSSVTALVNKLEVAGLVERHDAPDDKRVTLIALTTQGCKALHYQNDWTATSLDALSADEIDQLIGLLQKLLAAMPEQDVGWQQRFDKVWRQRVRRGERDSDFDPRQFFNGRRGF